MIGLGLGVLGYGKASLTHAHNIHRYYTDMDDRPVEQGEGCQVMPRTDNCAGPTYLVSHP